MWFVYVLKSKKYRKSYVGCTNNVERRLQEHNNGKSLYTKRFKPWELLKVEKFETYTEARIQERYYKSGTGRQRLRVLFKNL